MAIASRTEEENVASLRQYQQLEIEKAKRAARARDRSAFSAQPGIPRVKYHSLRLPLLASASGPGPIPVTPMAGSGSTTEAKPTGGGTGAGGPGGQYYERTLISFSDQSHYEQVFPSTNPAQRKRQLVHQLSHVRHICPISGLPARYMDPVTLTPYANLEAFSVIRQIHRQSTATGERPLDLLRRYKRQIALDRMQQQQLQQQPQPPHQLAAATATASNNSRPTGPSAPASQSAAAPATST